MASDDYVAVGGSIAAVVNASWATATAKRKAIDWIPSITAQVLKPDGTFNDQWYRFLGELARRLGGIQGASITEVQASVSQVQTELSTTTSTALSAAQLASANTYSIDVIREVANNAGLPGASNIP